MTSLVTCKLDFTNLTSFFYPVDPMDKCRVRNRIKLFAYTAFIKEILVLFWRQDYDDVIYKLINYEVLGLRPK